MTKSLNNFFIEHAVVCFVLGHVLSKAMAFEKLATPFRFLKIETTPCWENNADESLKSDASARLGSRTNSVL